MNHKQIVGIVVGSDSDLPVIKDAVDTLEEFGVPYELSIYSAHRSPAETIVYAKSAEGRGLAVIIAAAGGSAHLAGVIAAHVPFPVIGIPILTKSLGGVDSLYSIVQMPPGVPVATVGINAAKNAALLAIQILSVHDKALQKKMKSYKKSLARSVDVKNKKLQSEGIEVYLTGATK
jgi:5-(carboxyamino)imidazole ribonucleotide mutase